MLFAKKALSFCHSYSTAGLPAATKRWHPTKRERRLSRQSPFFYWQQVRRIALLESDTVQNVSKCFVVFVEFRGRHRAHEIHEASRPHHRNNPVRLFSARGRVIAQVSRKRGLAI